MGDELIQTGPWVHLALVTALALLGSALATGASTAAPATPKQRVHALAEAHYDVVWRVLRRLGLAPAAADDAAQQVFLIALQRVDDLEAGKERAFLCSTAVWVGRRARAGRPLEEMREELPEVASSDTPHGEVERRQLRQILDRMLLQLEEELREVLVLVELEGLSKREVALALGIPEGTVASRTRRGREQLNALAADFLAKGGAR